MTWRRLRDGSRGSAHGDAPDPAAPGQEEGRACGVETGDAWGLAGVGRDDPLGPPLGGPGGLDLEDAVTEKPIPDSWAGKTPTAEQWREILEKHAWWNRGEAEGERADLRGADLRGADLQGADLQRADLQGAYLQGAKNGDLAIARTRILPNGTLVAFKRCREGVVELSIPAEAKRSHAFGRKCRGEYAVVVATPDGKPAHSLHDGAFEYRVGETVRPDRWDDDWAQECSGGIHFYISRIEAEAHE